MKSVGEVIDVHFSRSTAQSYSIFRNKKEMV
jgi:hypothetical protein